MATEEPPSASLVISCCLTVSFHFCFPFFFLEAKTWGGHWKKTETESYRRNIDSSG